MVNVLNTKLSRRLGVSTSSLSIIMYSLQRVIVFLRCFVSIEVMLFYCSPGNSKKMLCSIVAHKGVRMGTIIATSRFEDLDSNTIHDIKETLQTFVSTLRQISPALM